MKKTNKILSFLIALSLILGTVCFFAYAAESEKNYYYIDSVNGDDANSGTEIDSPVKSIAGLKNLVIKPGTHFLFKRGGEYECAVTPFRATISAATAARVLIRNIRAKT